jgi:prophage regulatory protein
MSTTRIIRYSDLADLFGVSKSTIWRWRRSGSFPCHIALGPRAIGWRESDIEKWLISNTQPQY